jgi:hypothetical protein
MTCEECEQILLDTDPAVSRKGWVPGVSVMNLAKSHAQDCPACAAKMSDVAKMKEALDQLRLSAMQVEALAAIETELLAAFRRQTARSPVAKVFPWGLVWGSVTAALLIAAGVMLYSMLRPRSFVAVKTGGSSTEQLAQQSRGVSGATAQPVVKSHPTAKPDVTVNSAGKTTELKRATHERTWRRPRVVAGDELSLNGGGSIVRVTLPLSGLVAMGIPVHPDASDPRVTADVMMDPFGAVVGIRLVEANTRVN